MGIGSFFKTLFEPFKLILGDPNTKRILAEGRSGVAEIINISETDAGQMTVNNNPYITLELKVFEEGKDPYTTKINTLISRLAIHQFQPGKMLNIKIDPLDPMKVVLDTTGTGAEKIDVGNTDQPKIENGINGMAEVLEIRKTDREKNNNTVFELKLDVTAPGMDKYDFIKEVPLPEFALEHIIVGRKYPCIIDPNDKTKVMLDVKFS